MLCMRTKISRGTTGLNPDSDISADEQQKKWLKVRKRQRELSEDEKQRLSIRGKDALKRLRTVAQNT